MIEPAFLTGSRAYGTPREDSDIDLVVLVDEMELIHLMHLAELVESCECPASDAGPDAASIRFGKLNLIAVTTEHHWEIWRNGTIDLIARKPVTRDEAVEHFHKLRKEMMI